ncbi:MAG TPA: hypothetical protein DEQ40_05660 [Oxalobacteraceae bacterium]|nr:hypothetical protein [Oxalobacteraceae bacterium]
MLVAGLAGGLAALRVGTLSAFATTLAAGLAAALGAGVAAGLAAVFAVFGDGFNAFVIVLASVPATFFKVALTVDLPAGLAFAATAVLAAGFFAVLATMLFLADFVTVAFIYIFPQ